MGSRGTPPTEQPLRTLLTAAIVALCCAAMVSISVVWLRPVQERNRAADRRRSIEALIARLPGVEALVASEDPPEIESRVIELSTGHVVEALDPATFDAGKAADDPQMGIDLTPAQDLAGIGRRAKYATVFLVRSHGDLQLAVLPVYGTGYESRLHGFIALRGDANTVAGLTFYAHEETPGLGGEIDTPAWRAQWQGKRVHDEAGVLRLGVAPGKVEQGSLAAAYEVDAISGATMTSRGVHDLLRFWLGEDGFGPFLTLLRETGAGR